VDDTDDLDPEAEFEAWRLRELSRLTRDKEAALLRREEQEEIERRRALPEAQRLREDEEHARKTREEKDANRGERGFMEKFYHKGAFYQVCPTTPFFRSTANHLWITGGGYSEEKLQCQDRVRSGCVTVTKGYASPQFRQGE
jgi:hypothetical protein